jgi:polyisoprenoid-binding protein YceI
VKVTGKGRYELFGVLTIRGTAHEVVLEVEEADRDKGSPGEDHLAFVARGSISRARWNLEWSQALEAGGVLVSDKVDVEVKVRFVAKDSRSS